VPHRTVGTPGHSLDRRSRTHQTPERLHALARAEHKPTRYSSTVGPRSNLPGSRPERVSGKSGLIAPRDQPRSYRGNFRKPEYLAPRHYVVPNKEGVLGQS